MSRSLLLTTGLLLALFFCSSAWCEDAAPHEPIPPGEEEELEIPGYDWPCRLYVPSDYKRGVRTPLIFFLHGSGGKPTSWPWKSATEGKGYLIAGLSYGALTGGGRQGIQSDPESRRKMVKFIDTVRAFIDEHYGIDQVRVFLSGLSMGGWGVNFYGFLDEARGRYRGYCIMAAGIVQNPKPDLTVVDGMPLLLLNGANDANLAAANRGAPIYKKAGAIVKQVVLQDQGHVPSTVTMAPPLREWLAGIQREDERQRAFAAIQWEEATIKHWPPNTGGLREKLLLTWVKELPFVKEAPGDKPLLLYLHTDHRSKKGAPSKQALACEHVEDGTFGYPAAIATPAAARSFTPFRASMAALDKKTCAYLHRDMAPVVLLLDRARTGLRLLAKGKLKDAALASEMRTLLEPAEITAADERVKTTKPLLAEMRKLRSAIESEKKSLAKLRAKDASKVRKKLEKHTGALAKLLERYEALQGQLAD